MKLAKSWGFVMIILAFNTCTLIYKPFLTGTCKNTYWVNKRYKTQLSLAEISFRLKSQNFQITTDTIRSENGKWISPTVKIFRYSLNDTEFNWIQFTILEASESLIFYGYCLEKGQENGSNAQKRQYNLIKKQVEEQLILPLLK